VGRERGVALPLAMVTLLVVVSLALVLGALSVTEPVIASNQLLVTQARASAESGLEAALAAFSNTPTLSTAFAATVDAAPLTILPGTSAGYRIAISVDDSWSIADKVNQRRITVAGVAARGDLAGIDAAVGRAAVAIEAVLRRDSLLNTLLLPAALTLPAGASAFGAEVDARDPEGWCQRHRSTVAPLAGAAADGAGLSSGSVWGPGNDTPNESGPDILQRRASHFLFTNQSFTTHELAALKRLALATGTFHRGQPVVFDGGAPLPPGRPVVFVEGDVEIDAYGADTAWSGWIVAVGPSGAGSGGRITFRCSAPCAPARQQLTISGLLYAEDRLDVNTRTANRSVIINGAVIARNRDGGASRIEPRTPADFRINLRCQGDGDARRGVRDAIDGTPDTIGAFDPGGRAGWYVKAGSVRETAGQP
jgi:Tfp pilus assembly protein PilX